MSKFLDNNHELQNLQRLNKDSLNASRILDGKIHELRYQLKQSEAQVLQTLQEKELLKKLHLEQNQLSAKFCPKANRDAELLALWLDKKYTKHRLEHKFGAQKRQKQQMLQHNRILSADIKEKVDLFKSRYILLEKDLQYMEMQRAEIRKQIETFEKFKKQLERKNEELRQLQRQQMLQVELSCRQDLHKSDFCESFRRLIIKCFQLCFKYIINFCCILLIYA